MLAGPGQLQCTAHQLLSGLSQLCKTYLGCCILAAGSGSNGPIDSQDAHPGGMQDVQLKMLVGLDHNKELLQKAERRLASLQARQQQGSPSQPATSLPAAAQQAFGHLLGRAPERRAAPAKPHASVVLADIIDRVDNPGRRHVICLHPKPARQSHVVHEPHSPVRTGEDSKSVRPGPLEHLQGPDLATMVEVVEHMDPDILA